MHLPQLRSQPTETIASNSELPCAPGPHLNLARQANPASLAHASPPSSLCRAMLTWPSRTVVLLELNRRDIPDRRRRATAMASAPAHIVGWFCEFSESSFKVCMQNLRAPVFKHEVSFAASIMPSRTSSFLQIASLLSSLCAKLAKPRHAFSLVRASCSFVGVMRVPNWRACRAVPASSQIASVTPKHAARLAKPRMPASRTSLSTPPSGRH
mmetsp:Transcript_107977/g.344714  ORF Transcript_107977/g.344714 Transcript_107977/m.344714 type:complete len:212 (-) Transcript_107977:3935-4570(-)